MQVEITEFEMDESLLNDKPHRFSIHGMHDTGKSAIAVALLNNAIKETGLSGHICGKDHPWFTTAAETPIGDLTHDRPTLIDQQPYKYTDGCEDNDYQICVTDRITHTDEEANVIIVEKLWTVAVSRQTMSHAATVSINGEGSIITWVSTVS